MKAVQLNFVESDAKLVLEALLEMETKWASICESSDNEDEIAECGNDLTELRLLIRSIEEAAIPVFGERLLNFSRKPL